MVKARINFVHAEDPDLAGFDTFDIKPVWAFTLASHLADHPELELRLYDTRTCPPEKIPDGDLFLFSAVDQNYAEVCRVFDKLRKRYPSAKFILGGPICWSFEQAGWLDRLKFFDHLVIGNGEGVISEIVEDALSGGELEDVIRVKTRFPLSESRPMYRPFLQHYVSDSFGAVIEVSRGCPFLCEFCVIRVETDNNRAYNKPPEAVIEEIDHLTQMGVSAFTFACDNFIGDIQWANELVDRMIEWEEETGARPFIYTWLTINLYKHGELMSKMRRAGFMGLFIGVESFSQNSLLETAKVQNRTKDELPEVIRRIHSYGFMITAGVIAGFDSDGPDVFDVTIRGIEESSLLSVTPNILQALPGTPLHRRMKLAGRLRDEEDVFAMSDKELKRRLKIRSNIKYLLPRETFVSGYVQFIKRLCQGHHQYKRFKGYLDNLSPDRYVPPRGSLLRTEKQGQNYFRVMWRSRTAQWAIAKRLLIFSLDPRRTFYLLKGLWLTMRHRKELQGVGLTFLIWVSSWTRFVAFNWKLRKREIDVESVEGPFTPELVLPAGYDQDVREPIPAAKTKAQIRATVSQLNRLIAERRA